MSGDIRLKNINIAWKAIKELRNWPDYFLDLFNLTNKKYLAYHSRNGLKYFVRANTTDRGILTSIVLEDEYKTCEFVLPKNAVVIDIGAQIGIFSVYISKKAKKVFSYEPVPENFDVFMKNIRFNKLDNKIFPFNLAVSNKNEKIKIFLSKNNTGGHSAYPDFHTSKDNNYIDVRTISFKDVFEKNKIKNCDLLKIDVEGSEYNILFNLQEDYFKKISRIRMECHHIDNNLKNPEKLVNFLKLKGFKVVYKSQILFADRI